ncbi:MAG: fibronectin type III domain-containing protein, partial [bacterium]|nr:fibronectin type III domain-containing protein [bacterium]
ITSSETQSVVNAAVITLNSAVATFQASVVGDSDVTALNAAIASAQAIDLAAVAGTAPGQYPASAKTTLEAAIATAQTVNASDDQSIVDAAVVTLNVAVTTFQSTVIGTSDLSALSAAIASAQTLHDGAIEGIVPGNHTIGSKAIYQTAINNASLLTASDDQADIDTTVVTLASATNTFNASLVGASDLTVLSAAITSAQSLHDGATEGTAVGEYAVGSKAILQSAIDAASLVTSAEAQSVVNTAVTTLNSAVAVFSTQIIVGISSESNETPSSNSVTITWTTTHPATSRVVYDTVSHNPVTDQAPNYGYSNSTAEDTTLVTNHSITVTSLLPSTTYFFRSVSHGSPETYGNEVSVATTATPPSGGGGGSSFVVLSQPGFSGSTAFQTFPATAIIPTVSETTVRTVTPQVLGVRVFAEGALLRVDGQSIYIAQGNILHKIPNSDVLRRFASRTRIDITVEDIVGYTIGSSIPNAMPTYIARTLLRVNERDIYVVNGRMLNRVPNPRTLWPYRDYARIEVAGDALIEFTIGDSVPVL